MNELIQSIFTDFYVDGVNIPVKFLKYDGGIQFPHFLLSKNIVMDKINTEYLKRCLDILEKSYLMIKSVPEGSIDYEIYRNSLIKSFEMTLE